MQNIALELPFHPPELINFHSHDILNLSAEEIGKIIAGDNSFYNYSFLQKIVDFVRYLLTGNFKSNVAEKLFHQLRDINFPETISDTDKEHLMPIATLMAVLDVIKNQLKKDFFIRLIQLSNEEYSAAIYFDNQEITSKSHSHKRFENVHSLIFKQKDVDILKEFCQDNVSFFDYTFLNFDVDDNNKRLLARFLDIVLTKYAVDETHISEKFDANTITEPLLSIGRNQSIDQIASTIKGKPLASLCSDFDYLNAGTYGKVYRKGNFVIKIPVNNHGNKIDYSFHECANPQRVCQKLTMANNDPDFSRAVSVLDEHGKEVFILLSKYIEGRAIKKKEVRKALELLNARGLFMHDANTRGNILFANETFYFVDGDHLVLSKKERLERSPSLVTLNLENMLEQCARTQREIDLKKGITDGLWARKLFRIHQLNCDLPKENTVEAPALAMKG